jgi:hypothetical protein
VEITAYRDQCITDSGTLRHGIKVGGRMKFIATIGWLGVIALSACATPLVLDTASGNPEGRFPGLRLEQARNKVIAGCNDARYQVLEASQNQVTCGRQWEVTPEATLLFLTISTNASGHMQKVQFTLFEEGGGTRLSAREWVELQNPYGQKQTMPLQGAEQVTKLQGFIRSLGAV